ncbi:MAG: tetratricopeptide repeat protein [Verrucomicrobiia bacterium]|jgi:tetratricopeptide (TPR) repeat protein
MEANIENNIPRFARRILPWLVALAALIGYILTLNPWISVGNIANVNRISGLDWSPTVMAPLNYLITLPISLLPIKFQPYALNLLAAILAAATLGTLARSVAIFPQDRTREQRSREKNEFGLLSSWWAFLPPLIAVIVCGLQISYWRNAVNGTGEILDLFLFAYLIRCLLEYRIGEEDRWMYKFAFVYGLSMTNNWAMIGFLPLFAVAAIWIKGIEFFNLSFLWRFAVLFVAGLLFYLLLPLIVSINSAGQYTFWELLKGELGQQKSLLLFRGFRWPVFLLSLTSIVPFIFISIRWPSFEGDVSPVSNFLNNILFKFAHLAFWVLCLWAMYEPFYQKSLDNVPLQFLPFFYVTALCVGYFSGYLLLVFSPLLAGQTARQSAIGKLIGYVVWLAVWISLIAAPVAMLSKNLPKIQAMNNGALKKFAKQLVAPIDTAKKAVILSDELSLLTLAGFYFLEQGNTNHILIHTAPLVRHDYQKYLAKKYAGVWPAITNYEQFPEPIASVVLISQLRHLSMNHPIYYLNPSFGYYFEFFYPTTYGLVWQLNLYPNDVLFPPPVTQEEIKYNDTFWNMAAKETFPLVEEAISRKVAEGFALQQIYSRALNEWGVKLQRNNLFDEANKYFALAAKIYPQNEVAKVNLEFNAQLRSKNVMPISIDKEMWRRFLPLRSLDTIIKTYGSFDHPTFSFIAGNIFFQNGQLRQAATLFDRVESLHRDNIEAGLQMGYLYIRAGRADRALEQVNKLKTANSVRWKDPTNYLALVHLEVSAHFANKDIAGGEKILQSILQKNPKDLAALQTAVQIYMAYNMYSNALTILDKILEINSDDVTALLNKGAVCIQLNQFKQAVEALTKVINKQPSNYAALLNRAIANLQLGQLNESQRDYERILQIYPKLHTVHYGLGEIGLRKKDTAMATRHFEAYLKYAPEGTTERKQVEEKLKKLKAS